MLSLRMTDSDRDLPMVQLCRHASHGVVVWVEDENMTSTPNIPG